MGDCTSRPTQNEIEEHLNESNSKNDKYFRIVPFADDQRRLITSETSQDVLLTRKYFFDKKYKEFNRKSERIAKNSNNVQEFLIEIQKAYGLTQSGFCFNQGKPYVSVTLEPNGPSDSTFPADSFRPKWYKMLHFKTLLSFQSINFEVKVENSSKSLGSFSIKIKDLESQEVFCNWFPLSTDGQHSLKVRIQYIKDEKLLLSQLEKSCLDYIDEIEEVIRKLSTLTI